MVLRTVEPDSEEADGTRWSIMRTELPPDVLRNYWHAWVVGSWVSASASLFVIGVICSRPRLRSQAFNVFVVGLCIPDAVFSSMCGVTCLLNYRAGEYYGGTAMCDWQSLYCVFGFAASIWMNVVVTRELHRMALCTHAMKTYHPLPVREVRFCAPPPHYF